jgi:hypothetical protein
MNPVWHLVNVQKFGKSEEDAKRFGLSKPERRPVLSDSTFIRGNRTKAGERYRVRISKSLAEPLQSLGSPATDRNRGQSLPCRYFQGIGLSTASRALNSAFLKSWGTLWRSVSNAASMGVCFSSEKTEACISSDAELRFVRS